MYRVFAVLCAIVTAVVVGRGADPAVAFDPRCSFTMTNPFSGDGQLHAGPLYGGRVAAQETVIRCQARAGGPDGPPAGTAYYWRTPGVVGMYPPVAIEWEGPTGEIWWCTAVLTYPYGPTWTDHGCVYSHTYAPPPSPSVHFGSGAPAV